MDVRLPDGTVIRNVPEGTTRAQLTERLRRNGYDVSLLEETPPERTIGGYAKEAFKGLIPGAAGLAETAITGAAALLPEEAEQAVRERVSGVVEPIREAFAPAPGYEDTAVRKLSEAVGSTVPFLPLGALGAAGRAAAIGLGVGAGAGEARQRAEEEGATEEERGVATALGIGPGALEALPPIRILRRFGFGDEAIREVAGFVPALRRAAVAGGEEALQETSSQVLQNLIAKGVYAPDEAVFGGVGEAAALGGGAGAVVSAIADLALGRRLRGRGEEETGAKKPETPPEQLPSSETTETVPVEAVQEVAPEEPTPEERREELERRARELRFIAQSDDRLRQAIQRQETDEASKDDLDYLAQYDAALRARDEARRRPLGETDQMGLPLEGGFAQMDLLAPTEPGQPVPGMYRPAEEALEGLRPRSRAYKEEAKDLGLKLDRKGNLKPNQFVPEITSQVSPDQERFQFEEQKELPLTLPAPLEGQGDLFAEGVPIPPRGQVAAVPVEEPVTQEIPKEQFALNLPGIPMERLAPRDRVLRAMSITEDKKNIPNLRFATQLRPMELQKTLGDLKNEGAIAFNKKANEWELTPAGVENVRTSSPKAKPPRRGRSPRVSVPPQRTEGPDVTGVGERGVAGAGESVARADVGEGPSVTPLTKEEREALIRQKFQQVAARKAVDEVTERRTTLRTRAIDAFDADEINEKTYTAVTDELKKPVPNFARVTAMLEGTAKPKREKDVGLKFQQAPSPHPEWATKFERDVAGEVVYSDPDAALLRGHSVLSGQPVYMAVDKKTGNRTLVDIDAFSGTLFAPEQKQRLVEAKKRIVAEDAAKFAQNPDGPFTGATSNVVTSDSVNPNYGKFLSNLMNSMGLGDVRVFLLTPEDARTQRDKYKLYGYYSSAMSAGTDPGEEGSIRPYGENLKDFYISFKPGMSETRTLEVISHELGHLIERVAYNNASPETKNAIRAEYDQWLKDTKGKQGADLVRALRNRETAEAQASGMTADTKLRDSYWRSFSEWFADNTSKWVTTSEKPVGIVEKFFADVARKLRELVAAITGNRFVPAKAVKKFLDDMGPGSADSWIAERRRTDSVSGKLVDPFDDAARYSMSPTEQRDNDRKFINTIGRIPSNLPEATNETFQAAVDAASNVPPATRRALYSMINPHDMDRMYRKYTNGFGQLWDDLNAEGVFLRKEQDKITENIEKWKGVLDKYSPTEQSRIFKIFMDTTVNQIEVLDLQDAKRNVNWVAKKDDPIYKQFAALKPEVQEVYKQLRLAYLDYALGVENSLKQYLTPNEFQKLQAEFNAKRLPVYLPLFRKGKYKLKYVDRNKETVALQFESIAERDRAWAEAKREGATDRIYSEVGTRKENEVPPSGFFGTVVATLKKNKVDPAIINPIVNAYLDLIPAQSVLQFARKRAGTAGYRENVLEAYANVGDSYARRLANMTYTPKFFAARGKIVTDLEIAKANDQIDPDVAEDIKYVLDKQMDFIQNPKLDSLAAKASYFSYQIYLGANISTAIVNTLDIPTVVWSRLGGKHGFGKAFNSILKAGTVFFSKNKSSEMQELIRRGLDSGSLREQQLQDIATFKNLDSKYERLKAGTERVTNWAFAKSDMFNRQVALAAAYDLNKGTPEGVFDEDAFKQAQRTVYDVYGSSFPKASAPIMGNDIARTALTFKRFAIVRMNLLVNAYREATKDLDPNDPETKIIRDAARKEILGYFGSAFVFAGVQGMPIVGAGMVLANLLNAALGDDDEPYNPEFELREAIGLFNYKGPINYLTGVDIASRTGWTGMFWREDPRRMAEVGPLTYTIEQILGPAYAYFNGWLREGGVIDNFTDEKYQRGFEQLLPRSVGNILKAQRYAEEGALTGQGIPLVDDVSKYNIFMQVFGFRPSDVAEAGEEAGAAKRMESKIIQRRNAIIERAAVARMSGDIEGFQAAIEDAQGFSQKYPARAITSETLYGAIERRQKKMVEAVNGVRVDPKLARDIYEELGIEP